MVSIDRWCKAIAMANGGRQKEHQMKEAIGMPSDEETDKILTARIELMVRTPYELHSFSRFLIHSMSQPLLPSSFCKAMVEVGRSRLEQISGANFNLKFFICRHSADEASL